MRVQPPRFLAGKMNCLNGYLITSNYNRHYFYIVDKYMSGCYDYS